MSADSGMCTGCTKYNHMQCSGVHGGLSDSRCFMCNYCDSTTQDADLREDLVVDGEMVGCVKIFWYLGDTLGGEDLATTA